ncbi:MAG TPA: SRPBCC family protein, partial [Actinomycetota bacterium]
SVHPSGRCRPGLGWGGRAMESFTNVVTINRPAHDVFAFLADFENVPKWNYAITETRKSSRSRPPWPRTWAC